MRREAGRARLSALTDTFVAHYHAATNPDTRILHCDISGGNILIYPKVKRDSDGNDPVLIWTGILTDWELSKPLDTHEAAHRATQADRMVGAPPSVILYYVFVH